MKKLWIAEWTDNHGWDNMGDHVAQKVTLPDDYSAYDVLRAYTCTRYNITGTEEEILDNDVISLRRENWRLSKVIPVCDNIKIIHTNARGYFFDYGMLLILELD